MRDATRGSSPTVREGSCLFSLTRRKNASQETKNTDHPPQFKNREDRLCAVRQDASLNHGDRTRAHLASKTEETARHRSKERGGAMTPPPFLKRLAVYCLLIAIHPTPNKPAMRELISSRPLRPLPSLTTTNSDPTKQEQRRRIQLRCRFLFPLLEFLHEVVQNVPSIDGRPSLSTLQTTAHCTYSPGPVSLDEALTSIRRSKIICVIPHGIQRKYTGKDSSNSALM
jgi:hypothetical protein